MSHEKNIPPQQEKASKKIWIPRPDENRRGSEGDPQTPPNRQKTTRRVTGSLTFSKTDRLVKRSDFLRVQREGDRRVGAFLSVEIRPKVKRSRLGITAPKKYGSSPERNRFKRLVREAYRLNRDAFPPNVEMNVFPRQRAKEAKLPDIAQELITLCR